LADEPAPALLPVQDRAIEAKLRLSGFKPKLSWIPSAERGRIHWLLKTALAAAVVLLIGMPRNQGAMIGTPRIQVAIMNPAMSLLQDASTDTAYTMMLLSGIPVTKQGHLLWVGDAMHQPHFFSFGMDAVCTPFYSSLIFLVASVLLGNLYLRSPWKRLLLTLFVIPLVFVSEVLRMFTIAELCVHLGVETAVDSPIIHYGNPMFFALSLIPFALLLVWLRKLESKA
jgi:exosortase/archaeosortase family protein